MTCSTRDRAIDERFVRMSRDEGAIAVIVAISLVALIGVAALVVDVGSLYMERAKLQTAADSAALASAQELYRNPTNVNVVARRYVTINAPDVAVGNIAVTYPSTDKVRVSIVVPNSPLFFARIWGKGQAQVAAAATARIQTPGMAGVLPVAVGAKDVSSPTFGFASGQTYYLQEDAGPGNYGWMSLNYLPLTAEQLAGNVNKYKWKQGEVIAIFDQNGTDYPVYVNGYPDITGVKKNIPRAFQDWYDRGNRTAIFAVIPSSGPGSSNVLQVLGFVQMRLTQRPGEKGQAWAEFVRVMTEDDMVLGSYVPDMALQHVSLVQ